MKITYHQWKCVGCPKVVRFTDQNALLSMPYWFTLKTEGCRSSSSERPSFDTTVCSIDCLEKAGIIIRDIIQNRRHSIPRKKHIDATICNQCGKVVQVDRLIGLPSLENWIEEKSSAGRKDFCSAECQKNHFVHPENSFFAHFNFDDPIMMRHLIDSIDSPDSMEQMKKNSKRIFQFHSLIEQDITSLDEERK